MALQHFGQHQPEVGGDGKVASLMQGARIQAGPLAQYLAAVDAATQRPHHIAVPVVGAVVAVLAHRAAELRHHQHHRVVEGRAEPCCQCRQAGSERAQAIC